MGGSIHHHAEPILPQKIGDEVVNDAGLLVEHAAIQRLARLAQLVDVVGQQLAQEFTRPRAFQVHHRHMRHVEHTGIAAHRVVLLDLRAVIDRHVPTAEIHHPGTGSHVHVI